MQASATPLQKMHANLQKSHYTHTHSWLTQMLFASISFLTLQFAWLAPTPRWSNFVCIYLKRTVMYDLHYWRRTKVAWQLYAWCWYPEGKLLKKRVQVTFLSVFFFLNGFGRGSLIQVIALSLDFRCLVLATGLHNLQTTWAFNFF